MNLYRTPVRQSFSKMKLSLTISPCNGKCPIQLHRFFLMALLKDYLNLVFPSFISLEQDQNLALRPILLLSVMCNCCCNFFLLLEIQLPRNCEIGDFLPMNSGVKLITHLQPEMSMKNGQMPPDSLICPCKTNYVCNHPLCILLVSP